MTATTPLHALAGETLLSFAQAARELPSRHTAATLILQLYGDGRRRGPRRPAAERARLERVRIGTLWFTSREALARFLAALRRRPGPR